MAGWNTTDIDWTSAATIKPTLARQPYLVLYDIGEALRERADGSDYTPIAQVRRGDRPGIVFGMNSALSSLITRFADHTQNSGVYTNQSSIPMWTEANLETAIGTARPASPIRGDKLDADWVFWMYNAINLLLWYGVNDQVFLSAAIEQRTKSGSGASYAAAVTAFDAASWGSWAAASTYAQHRYNNSSGHVIDRDAVRFKAITAPSSSLSYQLDVYSEFSQISSWTYEDNDYSTSSPPTLGRVFNDTSPRSGNVPDYTVDIGNIDTATVTDSSPPQGWTTTQYFGGTYLSLVWKYDVANGFDYVAP